VVYALVDVGFFCFVFYILEEGECGLVLVVVEKADCGFKFLLTNSKIRLHRLWCFSSRDDHSVFPLA